MRKIDTCNQKQAAGNGQQRTSLFTDFLRNMIKSPSAKLGLCILVFILILCFIGPLVYQYDANTVDMACLFQEPCAEHIFGCDSMGRDLLARIMYGGRYSLALGLMTSFFSAALAVAAGCLAGYVGGKTENIIMRIMDVWSSLPGMLLCIIISAVLGSGFFTTVLALTIGGIPGGVRMVRGQVLSERTKEYIEAAQSINCSKLSIMFRHLMPNVVQPMIIVTTMGIGSTITQAATLSYIGLGVQPPTPEWGALLSAGRTYIQTYPYMIMFPGLAIALVVFAINLVGDGIRDALDPKLRD